ncbi:MAG: 2-oxo acid dehydrogenase subunit E2 [Candidatus Cloacimonetes bacterium]|nr:2-oxo acid dehydrogenase subunit E2 [Candidatus Cloacimonadota bacterium]
MATEIEMPKLGLSMQEGKITKWLHKEGDHIKKGEAILEISTDKISNVVESPVDGVLLKIYYEGDEVVPVHTTIAVIGEAEEKIEDENEESKEKAFQEKKVKKQRKTVSEKSEEISQKEVEFKISPVAKDYADKAGIDISKVKGSGPKNRVMKNDVKRYLKEKDEKLPEEDLADYGTEKVSPIAHEIAEQYEIDLSKIEGSGPKNRVLKNDVLSFIEKNNIKKPAIKTESQKISYDNISPVAKKLSEESNLDPNNITGTGPGGRVMKSDVERYINTGKTASPQKLIEKRKKISERRQVISKKMKESRQKTAHADVTIDIEVTEFMEFYKNLSKQFSTKLNLNALFIKAVTEVIKEYPIINSRLEKDEVVYQSDINVGLAVDSKEGLIVPVIKNTEKKGINQLSEEVNLIVNKAKSEELTIDEMENGTITISNLGMFNTKSLTPIINYPEVAIFGIGTINEKPIIKNGGIHIGKIVNVTLSFDHRLIDGALAAQVLNTLKSKLEEPESLI